MPKDDSHTFTIGSPLRVGVGLTLLSSSAIVLLISRTIDWGVAWAAVIPALVLLIPGWALLQRTTLVVNGNQITITTGWLWRRALVNTTMDATLELLPTAGLMAVVMHRGTKANPLATFILPRTAHRLATWLDQHHPTGAFPRLLPTLPEADR